MKKLLSLYSVLFLFAFSVKAQAVKNDPISEFFLEIKDPGAYTVSVNDQVIASPTGRFRFFDLPSGKSILSITQNGKVIAKADLKLYYANRNVASYSKATGLKMGRDLPIFVDGRYSLDNWDKPIATSAEETPSRPTQGRPGPRYVTKLSNDEFSRTYHALKRESFDDSRLKVFKLALRDNLLYVDQLTDLLEVFMMDDTRLEAAMYAYDHVIDRDHMYEVRSVFSFPSNKDKFDDFIANK